jgi:hypothetical protein
MRLRYFEPDGERERIERSIRLPYQAVRDALVGLGLHDHVAFEERPEDEEEVFEAMVKVGDEWQEVDSREAAIALLIKDIGGCVTAMNSLFEPDSTSVSISYVAGLDLTKLDRLIALLDELEGRRSRRKRRRR